MPCTFPPVSYKSQNCLWKFFGLPNYIPCVLNKCFGVYSIPGGGRGLLDAAQLIGLVKKEK